MAFETELTLRFGDVDFAGIAYYPRIYHYLHVAFEEFWDEYMGVDYATLCQEENLGFPAVHVQTDFQSPIRFGDKMRVQVWVSGIGRASVNFEYRLHVRDRLCAAVTMTVAAVDMTTLRPVAIPAKYRERMLACGAPGMPE